MRNWKFNSKKNAKMETLGEEKEERRTLKQKVYFVCVIEYLSNKFKNKTWETQRNRKIFKKPKIIQKKQKQKNMKF